MRPHRTMKLSYSEPNYYPNDHFYRFYHDNFLINFFIKKEILKISYGFEPQTLTILEV